MAWCGSFQPDKEKQPEQTETSQTAKGLFSLVCRSGCVVCCMLFLCFWLCRVLHEVSERQIIICFPFLGCFVKPQPTRNDSSTANRILHFSCGQRCAFHFSGFLLTHAQEESQLQGSELTATIGIVHDYETAKLFTSIPTRVGNFIFTRFLISA